MSITLILGTINKKIIRYDDKILLFCVEYVIDIMENLFMKNANANKVHSVHDFIIFLKAKIAIIIIMTGLLSSIAVYTQVDYADYW